MSIAVDVHGAIASIVLSGDIDYSSQDEFRRANERALSMDGIEEIHVDLAMMTFLDSSGIRALIRLQNEADASGRPLFLLNCSEKIREVFEIGGFDKTFSFR